MTSSRREEGLAASVTKGLIVFIHGYMDAAEVWARSIEHLSISGWRCEAASLHSANLPLGSSDELLEQYAQQVLDGLLGGESSELRVVIVGHSMGGQIAELLARRVGHRLAGLVLVTPAPLGGYPLEPAVMDRFASRAGLMDVDTIKEGKRSLAVALDEEAQELLVRATIATGRSLALEQLRAWTGGHTAGKHPSQVDAPVLTIATDDKFFNADMLAQEASRYRTSSFVKIHDAGHWPQLEQPASLASEIARFIGLMQRI